MLLEDLIRLRAQKEIELQDELEKQQICKNQKLHADTRVRFLREYLSELTRLIEHMEDPEIATIKALIDQC